MRDYVSFVSKLTKSFNAVRYIPNVYNLYNRYHCTDTFTSEAAMALRATYANDSIGAALEMKAYFASRGISSVIFVVKFPGVDSHSTPVLYRAYTAVLLNNQWFVADILHNSLYTPFGNFIHDLYIYSDCDVHDLCIDYSYLFPMNLQFSNIHSYMGFKTMLKESFNFGVSEPAVHLAENELFLGSDVYLTEGWFVDKSPEYYVNVLSAYFQVQNDLFSNIIELSNNVNHMLVTQEFDKCFSDSYMCKAVSNLIN